MAFLQTWRLDTILQGTTPDLFYREWLYKLTNFIKEIETSSDLASCILAWEELSRGLRQISSYADCLFSENVANPEGQALSARTVELQGVFQKVSTQLDHRLLKEEHIEALLADPRLLGLSFPIRYRKEVMRQKMDIRSEALVTDLAMFGYHSWHEFYKQAISQMKVSLNTKEVTGTFSYSQLENYLSHPSRDVRQATFLGIEEQCKENETTYAHALRSIFGFRLQLYRHRGWTNPFHEALFENRMQPATLKVLWQVASDAAPIFHRFFDEKAKLLGLEKLSWYDLEAPVSRDTEEIPYEKACEIIIEAFSKASPDMGAFAKRALENGWVEAENRPSKAPGGFCTTLPMTNESRVFMNYSGTMHNVLVLAHELGHAYHSHVCFDLPEMAQIYPMSLAETASTTAELIVLDNLLSKAKTKAEKKRLLYEKASRSSIFFINIRSRFLFEEKLFQEYHKVFMSPHKLCELMLDAQKESYGNRLETYHPYFWLTKIHFFFTELPSYNFPYTFGYLLSLAIFARSKSDPGWFSDWYRGFLQDTGRMTVEGLIKKHFSEELEKPLFWQKAVAIATSDIEEFISL